MFVSPLYRRLRRSRAFPFIVAIATINLAILSIMSYDADVVNGAVEGKFQKISHTSTSIVANEVSKEWALQNYFNTKLSYEYRVPDSFHNQKPFVYDYDPRLTNAVYLHQIIKQYEASGQDLSKMELPFSWYDWADLTALNGYIELPPEDKPTCEYVCARQLRKAETSALQKKIDELHTNMENQVTLKDDGDGEAPEDEEELKAKLAEEAKKAAEEAGEQPVGNQKRSLTERKARVRNSREAKNCDKYCRTDTSPNQPGFRVFKQLYKGRPNLKTVHGRSFLYSEAPSPNSLVFVTNKGNLQINVKSNDDEDDKQVYNMVNQGLVQQLIDDRSADVNILSIYQDMVNTMPITKPHELDIQYRVDLEPERFHFNGPEYLATHTPQTRSEKAFYESVNVSLNTRDEALKKYLNEAMLSKGSGMNGGHFDIRFFNAAVKYTDEDRQAVLTRLLRTWFALTSNAGLYSWVAHGALLAHEFNGVGFPWDDDLDLQMPYADFAKLALLYNSSVIVEDAEYGYGRYYLDTTNSLTHRSKGNGLNRIDGRFIDINTGYFIDITALGVSPISIPARFVDEYKKLPGDYKLENRDPNVILDDYYTWLTPEEELELSKDDASFADRMKKLKDLRKNSPTGLTKTRSLDERWDINYRLNIFNCRNDHTYVLSDLSPLRLSFQDKTRVYVPNKVEKLLKLEYKTQPKLAGEFRANFFIPSIRNWIPFETALDAVPKVEVFQDFNSATQEDTLSMLDNDKILLAYRKTWDATLLHEKERKIIEDENLSDEQKEAYLEELMMGRNFDPIFKDLFMSKLEARALEGVDVKELFNVERKKMKEQIKKEYKKQVDYTFGDSSLKLQHDFNKVSRTLKDDLYDYQFNGYNPDLEAKIVQLQKQIDSVSKLPESKMTDQNKKAIADWQEEIMKLFAKKTENEEKAAGAKKAKENGGQPANEETEKKEEGENPK